jgi:hypothetical protein
VAEWTKAAALKAVEGHVSSVGSNPTPSANSILFTHSYEVFKSIAHPYATNSEATGCRQSRVGIDSLSMPRYPRFLTRRVT